MRGLLISVSVVALMMPICANASETVTYSYDAQGRLVQSVISGTVNNGQTSSTTFDAANNRTNYAVSLSGGTPPPPPSNQPPVTVADAFSVPRCAIRTRNMASKISDPEGNVPLVLLSVVNSNSSLGSSSLVGGTLSISYEAYATVGSDTVTYTVRDSLGATATGTLTVNIAGGLTGCQSLLGAPPTDNNGGGN